MWSVHKKILCVKNLPEYTEQIIQQCFTKYGKILSYKFVETNDPIKKDALIEFESEHFAIQARKALHGKVIRDAKLCVDFAFADQAKTILNGRPEEKKSKPSVLDRIIKPKDMKESKDLKQPDSVDHGQFQIQRKEEISASGVKTIRTMIVNKSAVNERLEARNGENGSVGNMKNLNEKLGASSQLIEKPTEVINAKRNLDQLIAKDMINGEKNSLEEIQKKVKIESRPPQPVLNPYETGTTTSHVQKLSGSSGANQNSLTNSGLERLNDQPHSNYQVKAEYGNGEDKPVSTQEPPQIQKHDSNKSKEAEDANIKAIFAKNPELKAHIENPEIFKALFEIFRKEMTAIVSKTVTERERSNSSHRHRIKTERSYSRNRKRSYSSSPRHRHYSRKRSHSRSISRSKSPRQTQHSSGCKHSDRHKSVESCSCSHLHSPSSSRRFSRSHSRSHGHRCSCSGSDESRRSTSRSHSRHCGHSKTHGHRKRTSHRDRRYRRDSRRHHHRSRENSRSRDRKRENRSKSRSHTRSKDRKDRHRHSGSRPGDKPEGVNNDLGLIEKNQLQDRLESSNSNQVEEKKFSGLSELAKKDQGFEITQLYHTGDIEDPNISQAFTQDSLKCENGNSLDTSMQSTLSHQFQPQDKLAEDLRKSVKIEPTGFQYSRVEDVLPRTEPNNVADNETVESNFEVLDLRKTVQEQSKPRFIYSSFFIENKETNRSFNVDIKQVCSYKDLSRNIRKIMVAQNQTQPNKISNLITLPQIINPKSTTPNKPTQPVQPVQSVQPVYPVKPMEPLQSIPHSQSSQAPQVSEQKELTRESIKKEPYLENQIQPHNTEAMPEPHVDTNINHMEPVDSVSKPEEMVRSDNVVYQEPQKEQKKPFHEEWILRVLQEDKEEEEKEARRMLEENPVGNEDKKSKTNNQRKKGKKEEKPKPEPEEKPQPLDKGKPEPKKRGRKKANDKDKPLTEVQTEASPQKKGGMLDSQNVKRTVEAKDKQINEQHNYDLRQKVKREEEKEPVEKNVRQEELNKDVPPIKKEDDGRNNLMGLIQGSDINMNNSSITNDFIKKNNLDGFVKYVMAGGDLNTLKEKLKSLGVQK